MHGWARVSVRQDNECRRAQTGSGITSMPAVNKFSYRGCAPRSHGHLSPRFYELKSYCDGVFWDYKVLPVDLTSKTAGYDSHNEEFYWKERHWCPQQRHIWMACHWETRRHAWHSDAGTSRGECCRLQYKSRTMQASSHSHIRPGSTQLNSTQQRSTDAGVWHL